MRSKFEWQKRVHIGSEASEQMQFVEYKECILPLPKEEGEVFTALIARIQREQLPEDGIEITGVDALYFPALYLEVRHCHQVRVAGCIPLALSNTEGSSWISRTFPGRDLEYFTGDQEELSVDPERAERQELRKAAKKKFFELDGEYCFEDAEDVVRGFIKDVVSGLRADAFKFQETFGGDVLSVTEVAELFGVPRNTVLNWIKNGGLKAFRLGSKWMIERKDLAAAMEQAKGHAGA